MLMTWLNLEALGDCVVEEQSLKVVSKVVSTLVVNTHTSHHTKVIMLPRATNEKGGTGKMPGKMKAFDFLCMTFP